MKRYPYQKNDPLQAWDSADELLIAHLKSQDLKEKRILLVNDQFGALAVGLLAFNITSYTDSFVSHMGAKINSENKVETIQSLNELEGIYDFVLIQLPKNLSFFEDILCHLTNHLDKNSQIICGGMVKHMSPGHFDLLNKYIGATTTSLAAKKARLIFAKFEKQIIHSPYPLTLKFEEFEKPFTHHSNLFSREKLDIGTRFLLENMPKGRFERILDIGCANGILGIKAKMLNPEAKIIFSDESFMAIESAKNNYQSYFSDSAEFFWTNCFENQPAGTLDLVLCNPPFHQKNTLGDFIAWQMFTDSYHSLKKGGVIRVIGNSHLGYQIKLKKIFGNAKIVATNSKFMIIDAVK